MPKQTILKWALDIRGALKALDLGYRTSRLAAFDELQFALKRIEDIIIILDPEKLKDDKPIGPVLTSLEDIAESYINAGGDKVFFNFKQA